MIRKVFAQNFRSIKAMTLDLTGFDCLVGPNNSGKSNILDIFSFLADTAASGLTFAADRREPSLRYYSAPDGEPTIVEVSVAAPIKSHFHHLEYTLGIDTERMVVEREILNGFQQPGQAITLLAQQKIEGVLSSIILDKAGQGRSGGGMANTALYQFSNETSPVVDGYTALAYLNRKFRAFRHYRLAPEKLKSIGPATRVALLGEDGSGFASYLHTIHSGHRAHFNRIEEQLKKSFPSIDELLTPLSEKFGGQTEVGIKEKWFRKNATGRQLSDGLVGFIAYLAILYGPEEPSLVAIEEPENHIHPRLMERLVDMLRGASKDQQIMLSTHSVSLVNRLKLEDLVIVERDENGGTSARHVSAKTELKAALKEWALGEAYASGILDAE